MISKRFYDIAFFLLVGLLSLFAVTCDGTPEPEPECNPGNLTRTQGCDEFKRWNATVYHNGAAFANAGWHPLAAGDTISTNNTGEAELNFADCWSGHIYCFRDSGGSFQVENCRKADFPGAGTCAELGSWYIGDCATEFNINTGSISVQAHSFFSLTYLPEYREISLVVVLNGKVEALPVLSYAPTELGSPIPVGAGEFLFTMPDDLLSTVAGLEPRETYSLDLLPEVADELGIQVWMFDVGEKAQQDGVLPENWPFEQGGSGVTSEPPIGVAPGFNGFLVTGDGGALADSRVQQALYMAIDWGAAAEGAQVTAILRDEPIDAVNDLGYDPEQSRVLLEESGYATNELFVFILIPAGDGQLEKTASVMIDYLAGLGIEAVVENVPASEVRSESVRRIQEGDAVITLTR